jgi:hypothetical protein
VEFFWHMPGRPEENYENLSQGSWCPTWDLSQAPQS